MSFKEKFINECFDVLKREDVKYEIKKIFHPLLEMILQYLYPYIYLSLVFVIISFLLILGTIIEKLINPNVPLGYSTLIIVVIFFSGIQILFLGLIGEYVGKILKNVNKESQYNISILKKKINSD